MTTPFLVGFARAVLARLQEDQLVEVTFGSEERVALHVGAELAAVPHGGSLITSLARALLSCPDVHELYADDQQLKGIVQHLDATPATWIRG